MLILSDPVLTNIRISARMRVNKVELPEEVFTLKLIEKPTDDKNEDDDDEDEEDDWMYNYNFGVLLLNFFVPM